MKNNKKKKTSQIQFIKNIETLVFSDFMEKPCVFCKILKKEISSDKIWENDKFYAFLDITPVNPGHFMIIPKKHVDYFFEIPEEDYKEIFQIAKKLQKALLKATNAKRIGLVVEGFAVPHAHLHLLPLHLPNDIDPCRAKKGIPEEMKQMAEKIRKTIEEEMPCNNK